jgi:hypothetical protein
MNRFNLSRFSMGKTSKGKRKHRRELLTKIHLQQAKASPPTSSDLQRLPVSYQEINDYYQPFPEFRPFDLRKETFTRIEAVTRRPLMCYVSKTANVAPGLPTAIDDSDLIGFTDLLHSASGTDVDILIESNGGSAEAAERIVRLIRDRFQSLRFIIPGNAYSAATLICFSGDELIMGSAGTLGPIDPQINGIPARAIRRAFETLEERLAKEGPKALTAYVPLISKYDLHLLEMCKSAEALSQELAETWISEYMLKCSRDDAQVRTIVDHFSDYDVHKSHGRSIGRNKATELGLKVQRSEATEGLDDLIRSLHNQYSFWFDRSPFVKMFEDARGISWGRQAQTVTVQLPMAVPPLQPGLPMPTS